MRIALISTYTIPLALGLRYLSATLKRHGHDVRLLFMAGKRGKPRAVLPPPLIDSLVEHLKGADLIGLSLMTNTFHRACRLTQAVRDAGLRTPIVWGGVHPTMAPEESIAWADFLCIGEGEQTLLELADTLEAGRDPAGLQGLWLRLHDRITRNPVRPLVADLDALPFPDYECENHHYLVQGDALVPARPELLRSVLSRYRILTARGCPHQCAFCNNAALRRLYRGMGPYVRLRSNQNVIAELQDILARFPSVEAVNVVDDLFFIRDEENLAEFARLYAERINLPIELDAFPATLTPGKIEILRRLPLALVSMGIQSGCEDTLFHLYRRRTPVSQIARAIDLLADHRVPAEYHYIINNPYESDASMIETLRFAARHHRGPAIVRVFPLALYPGTPLHERAVADGIIPGRHEAAYDHTYDSRLYVLADTYLAIVLRTVLALKGLGCPARLAETFVNLAVSPPVRWCLDRPWFPRVAYVVYRVGHFIARRIIRQCVVRPLNRLRGRPRAGRLRPLARAA